MNIDLSSIWNQISPILAKTLGWAIIFLAPVKPIIFAIGFLVIVDLITGIWAAHKRNERIASNGIRRTITKTLAYMAAIICSHVMNIYFLQGIIDPVKVVSGLIAVTEFQSLMENLSSILQKDLWKVILEKLQGQKIIPVLKEKKKKPKKKRSPRKR